MTRLQKGTINGSILGLALWIVILLGASWCWGADYYVRPAGGTYGAEDGTSYANAYDGFADIVWATVDTGNGKLFVCGTHAEQMTVGASGEDGTPIYIASCTVANGASTEDPGIIDGNDILTNAISTGNQNYIIIDGITVTEITGSGVPAGPGNSIFNNGDHNTVRNCTIYNQNTVGIGSTAPVDFIIEYNTIDSTTGASDEQNDAITFNGGSGTVYIQGNTIYERKSSGFYTDGIHLYSSFNGTAYISGNYCVITNDTTPNFSMCLQFASGDAGTAYVYNNVFYSSQVVSGSLVVLNYGTGMTCYFYNNTVINTTGAGVTVANSGNTGYFINNIFYSGNETSWANNSAITPDTDKLNYNLYYRTTGTPLIRKVAATGRTFAEWQAEGYEANGVNADPLFTAATTDFHLQGASPARNTGADLGATYDTDFDGNSQDRYGRGWEMGAYAFKESPCVGFGF